ncbi:putative RNase P subunit Pop3 [Lyophyllum shimeji]|uniref:RNase P subunit Pop3 n=1 Tax=Lyophyllum shimeji TaxID=47721 RepID=A0A9P3PGZ3_LYOSH|nr:putative RNase P subunit Pop3 [Lyophyllum shimeji]
MSEKTARVHSHVSNRAKNREVGERKVVFKSVLDNPFRIQWPSVPLDVQNAVLAKTLTALDGIAQYQMGRKRKRKPAQDQPAKKKKLENLSAQIDASEPSSMQAIDVRGSSTVTSENEGPSERPVISEHLVIGINEVTKRLESQIRRSRITLVTTSENPPQGPPPSPLQLILVCRGDINPSILIDHLPHLVAAYNSLKPQALLRLVPLPRGAESSLSQALGLRRAAVLGIDSDWSGLGTLVTSAASVPPLSATWLASSMPLQKFVPTHIKQVRTSAPKDMKAEKQRRKEEKALKKEARRKQKTVQG